MFKRIFESDLFIRIGLWFLCLLVLAFLICMIGIAVSHDFAIAVGAEIDRHYKNIEIDGFQYNLVNGSPIYSLNFNSGELHTITLDAVDYGYIQYDNTIFIYIEDGWYQYMLE